MPQPSLAFALLTVACGGTQVVPERTDDGRCGFTVVSERMGPQTVAGRIQSVESNPGPRDMPGNAMRMKVVGDDGQIQTLYLWAMSGLPVAVGDRLDASLDCVKSGCDAHVSVNAQLVMFSSHVGSMQPPTGWNIELGPALPAAYRETDNWVQREHSLVARHGQTSLEFGRSHDCVVANIGGEEWLFQGRARKTEQKSDGADSTGTSDMRPSPDETIYSITRARSRAD